MQNTIPNARKVCVIYDDDKELENFIQSCGFEIMKVDADVTVKEDGEMTLKVPEESAEKTKELLLGLELHIKELRKQYPKNVTITTEV